mgnify:CR=1 FL=1
MALCVDFATRLSDSLCTSINNAGEFPSRVSCLNIGKHDRSADTDVDSLSIMIRLGHRAFTR